MIDEEEEVKESSSGGCGCLLIILCFLVGKAMHDWDEFTGDLVDFGLMIFFLIFYLFGCYLVLVNLVGITVCASKEAKSRFVDALTQLMRSPIELFSSVFLLMESVMHGYGTRWNSEEKKGEEVRFWLKLSLCYGALFFLLYIFGLLPS